MASSRTAKAAAHCRLTHAAQQLGAELSQAPTMQHHARQQIHATVLDLVRSMMLALYVPALAEFT